MVLALTLTLVLVLTLALAPSGMISKKGVPEFCPSTVLLLLLKRTIFLEGSAQLGTPRTRKKKTIFLEVPASLGTPRTCKIH